MYRLNPHTASVGKRGGSLYRHLYHSQAGEQPEDVYKRQPEELATHFSSFWDSFLEWGKSYLPRLVAAIVILLVGWYLVKWICRSVKKAMSRGKTDAGVTSFVNSALKICLWIVLLLVVAEICIRDSRQAFAGLAAEHL